MEERNSKPGFRQQGLITFKWKKAAQAWLKPRSCQMNRSLWTAVRFLLHLLLLYIYREREKGLTSLKPSQDMEQFLVLSVLTTRMKHVNDRGQLLLFLLLVAAANHTNQRLPVPWERSEGSGLWAVREEKKKKKKSRKKKSTPCSRQWGRGWWGWGS